MAKDEVLFTLENAPEDKDYEDVYRIHLEAERKDRKIALITCIVLAVVCIVLLIVLRNISFLFYAAGCVLVGIAYIKVDSNRKFIATNRLIWVKSRSLPSVSILFLWKNSTIPMKPLVKW